MIQSKKLSIKFKDPIEKKKDQKEKDEKSDTDELNPDSDSDKESKIFEKDPTTPMGKRIKRPIDQVVKHKSKFLKNNSNFIAITGASGTGKTVAVLTLLPMFTEKTKYVILASAKHDDPAHKAIETYCQHEKINFSMVHEPEETGNKIADVLDEKKPDEHMIVIFDDFLVSYSSVATDPYNAITIKVFSMLRSSNCSAIIITQVYYVVPTRVRESLTMRIVFALGNVHSVRAMLDDICGLFITTENEKSLKKVIKNIYQQVYETPHAFIVVVSQPTPPCIRMGWNDVIFPPSLVGKDPSLLETESSLQAKFKDGSAPFVDPKIVDQAEPDDKPKRKKGQGLEKHQQLYHQAVDLGYPRYMSSGATKPLLEKYVKVASAAGEKKIGNTAPEIDEVLNTVGQLTLDQLWSRFLYRIYKYRETNNPKQLEKVAEIANQIIKRGGDLQRVKYLLRKNDLDEEVGLS